MYEDHSEVFLRTFVSHRELSKGAHILHTSFTNTFFQHPALFYGFTPLGSKGLCSLVVKVAFEVYMSHFFTLYCHRYA